METNSLLLSSPNELSLDFEGCEDSIVSSNPIENKPENERLKER